MFGYSKRDIVGQNINNIIPEPISTVHQQYLSLFVRTGNEVRCGLSLA
jgi:PAS domain S-box-containing protein